MMNNLLRRSTHKLLNALLRASVIALAFGFVSQSLAFASPPLQNPGSRPGSRPQNSNAPLFTIDVYPGSAITLPGTVNCGYVVILENAAGNINNQATWSDVAVFYCNVDATHSNQLQLIPKGGAFPSVATVLASANVVIVRSQTCTTDGYVTTYNSGANTYIFHSPCNIPREVPEADTLLLMGGGLGGLATWMGWQWRKVRGKK